MFFSLLCTSVTLFSSCPPLVMISDTEHCIPYDLIVFTKFFMLFTVSSVVCLPKSFVPFVSFVVKNNFGRFLLKCWL